MLSLPTGNVHYINSRLASEKIYTFERREKSNNKNQNREIQETSETPSRTSKNNNYTIQTWNTLSRSILLTRPLAFFFGHSFWFTVCCWPMRFYNLFTILFMLYILFINVIFRFLTIATVSSFGLLSGGSFFWLL